MFVLLLGKCQKVALITFVTLAKNRHCKYITLFFCTVDVFLCLFANTTSFWFCSCERSNCFFFFQSYFDLVPLHFHINFDITFLISIKHSIRFALGSNRQIYLWRNGILTLLCYPVHGHGISLYLLISSIIFLSNIVQFSVCRFCKSELSISISDFDAIRNILGFRFQIVCFHKKIELILYIDFIF